MTSTHTADLVAFYDSHPINEDEILAKVEAGGTSLDGLTQPDLEAFDQDHYGGTRALAALVEAADITSAHHVLDVCSGMGGPARWLAHQRQCRVTGLDLTQTRVDAARRLTARVGLEHLVMFVHGDATTMPLETGRFDRLISQESWLHVPDKPAVIGECVRVLKPGGKLAFTDVVVSAPLDAATDARLGAEIRTANLASAAQYLSLLEAHGCEIQTELDLSEEWKTVLVDRLAMYRSLRDTTIAKFGESHFEHYDNAYSHFVQCFVDGKLGGVRIVAQTPC